MKLVLVLDSMIYDFQTSQLYQQWKALDDYWTVLNIGISPLIWAWLQGTWWLLLEVIIPPWQPLEESWPFTSSGSVILTLTSFKTVFQSKNIL